MEQKKTDKRDKFQRWIKKYQLDQKSSLFYQFIFTYGTMTVITILSIIIFLMKPYTMTTENDSDIWAMLINSYIPTTITFVGVILFEDDFFKKHKFKGVLLEFLIVTMCLSYIAFVSINEVETLETHQKILINFIRILNILLMIPSIGLMPINNDSSDGQISH